MLIELDDIGFYLKGNREIPKVILKFLTNLKQQTNASVYFFGSVTNFTYFNGHSDIDVRVIYDNDEIVHKKIKKFVEENDTIDYTKSRVNLRELTLNNDKYKENVYMEIYKIKLDDKYKLDMSVISMLSPLIYDKSNIDTLYLIIFYILKVLYYKLQVIPKSIYKYLKSKTHDLIDFFNKTTTVMVNDYIII
jgi:hypothetical protein